MCAVFQRYRYSRVAKQPPAWEMHGKCVGSFWEIFIGPFNLITAVVGVPADNLMLVDRPATELHPVKQIR